MASVLTLLFLEVLASLDLRKHEAPQGLKEPLVETELCFSFPIALQA